MAQIRKVHRTVKFIDVQLYFSSSIILVKHLSSVARQASVVLCVTRMKKQGQGVKD